MQSVFSPRRARGLSLIEIMIALAIGSLLLVGLVQVFAASRAAYQTSEGMSRVQENGRFAMEFLQRDLRMAGHYGCVNDQAHMQSVDSLDNHFPVATGASWGVAFPNSNPAVGSPGGSIRGYEATNTEPGQTVTLGAATAGWTPALPPVIAALNPLPGSDIIEVRYLGEEGLPVINIANPSAAQTIFTVPAARWATFNADGVGAPTMFGIADCSFANVFPAAAVNPGAGTVLVNAFIDRYVAQPVGTALLHRAESFVYYVANGASGQPSLWRARADVAGTFPVGGREELVEGIESLQFLFGLDSVVDITVTPPSGFITQQSTGAGVVNNPMNWRRVGMVQVGILASSPDTAAAAAPQDAQRRRALGVVFAPPAVPDGRFRTTYETTVAMRNRLYGN